MALWAIGNVFDAKPCPSGCAKPPVLYTDTGTNDFWMLCETCERETRFGSAYSAMDYWNKDMMDKPE